MKMDRTLLVMENNHQEAEQADRRANADITPMERLRVIQTHRQAAYGNEASGRLQRVLEVAERE